MKSLEKVIKLKSKFMSNITDPLYLIPSFATSDEHNFYGDYSIFISKNNIDIKEEITLLEEMIPLLIYISSCVEYSRGEIYGSIYNIKIKLKFPNNNFGLHLFNLYQVTYTSSLFIVMKAIKDHNENKMDTGHCSFFKKPFKVNIVGNISFPNPYVTFQEEIEEKHEKEEEVTINGLKTFKVEQCVICFDNIPNFLFCNCGHLCVCKTCIKKFTKCPICKKENTILRIIE